MESLTGSTILTLAPTAWAGGGKSGFYSEFQFILVANSIKDDTGRKERKVWGGASQIGDRWR